MVLKVSILKRLRDWGDSEQRHCDVNITALWMLGMLALTSFSHRVVAGRSQDKYTITHTTRMYLPVALLALSALHVSLAILDQRNCPAQAKINSTDAEIRFIGGLSVRSDILMILRMQN